MRKDLKDEAREALHVAAQRGAVEIVAALIGSGADVNQFDDLGHTPLHYAAAHEHLDVAQLLLASGANVNARQLETIGNTPLRHVADRCSLAMATLLVQAGADPTIPGWMSITALDKASARRRGEGPQVYALLRRAAR
jgi:ankyrin repeat protein